MSILKVGSKLKSAVCEAQIMVIRTVPEPLDLRCGGAPMLPAAEPAPADAALDESLAEGTLIGKRYIDATDRIELLCTKGGKGSLSLGTERLLVKQPKALPSSD
ncbi:MAG TPA: hypothetical protein VKZ79_12980 [Alphaproteobacteria bacterium]|nr:hypothetical protein [Alphaproteobacteria bacterium]